jgi:hypothetical protein
MRSQHAHVVDVRSSNLMMMLMVSAHYHLRENFLVDDKLYTKLCVLSLRRKAGIACDSY